MHACLRARTCRNHNGSECTCSQRGSLAMWLEFDRTFWQVVLIVKARQLDYQQGRDGPLELARASASRLFGTTFSILCVGRPWFLVWTGVMAGWEGWVVPSELGPSWKVSAKPEHEVYILESSGFFILHSYLWSKSLCSTWLLGLQLVERRQLLPHVRNIF